MSASEARGRALMVAAGLSWLAVLAVTGCSDEEAATKALRSSGFTHIMTTGWSPLSCSDSDTTCTGFEAVGPTGIRVEGVVGCGWWFKGCTVRLK